ncbi:hypothetical protein B0H63DRAFT_86044 [Podospora didyma]|uniref:Uncharacterized protein n=1 Tax=Podospora didyma TaxID=330526 RepID=A0AAE0N1U6_9PEZI|nr:hypothetical protein B0H63DRAFT_86044 [Podospora didyma]
MCEGLQAALAAKKRRRTRRSSLTPCRFLCSALCPEVGVVGCDFHAAAGTWFRLLLVLPSQVSGTCLVPGSRRSCVRIGPSKTCHFWKIPSITGCLGHGLHCALLASPQLSARHETVEGRGKTIMLRNGAVVLLLQTKTQPSVPPTKESHTKPPACLSSAHFLLGRRKEGTMGSDRST